MGATVSVAQCSETSGVVRGRRAAPRDEVKPPTDLSMLLHSRGSMLPRPGRDGIAAKGLPPRAFSVPVGGGGIADPRRAVSHQAGNRQRGMSVSAEVDDFKIPTKKASGHMVTGSPMSKEAEDIIMKALRSNFLFNGLTASQTSEVVRSFVRVRAQTGEVIIAEGRPGDNVYVVESGRYTATRDGTVVCEYEDEGSFGEIAVMHNCPRAATVVCKASGVLWALDRGSYRGIVVTACKNERKKNIATIAMNPHLCALPPEQRSQLADSLVREIYQDGEVILAPPRPGPRPGPAPGPRGASETDRSDSGSSNGSGSSSLSSFSSSSRTKMFLVERGEVRAYCAVEDSAGPDSARLLRGVRAGEYFGESAVLGVPPHYETIPAVYRAAGEVEVVSLTLEAFERVTGRGEPSIPGATG